MAVDGVLPVVVYTVPVGRTFIARSILVVNSGAAAHKMDLRINGTACYSSSIPGAETGAVPDDVILNPGDVLSAVWDSVAGVGTVGVYGSLLAEGPS